MTVRKMSLYSSYQQWLLSGLRAGTSIGLHEALEDVGRGLRALRFRLKPRLRNGKSFLGADTSSAKPAKSKHPPRLPFLGLGSMFCGLSIRYFVSYVFTPCAQSAKQILFCITNPHPRCHQMGMSASTFSFGSQLPFVSGVIMFTSSTITFHSAAKTPKLRFCADCCRASHLLMSGTAIARITAYL